jgi:hypothetical protein
MIASIIDRVLGWGDFAHLLDIISKIWMNAIF